MPKSSKPIVLICGSRNIDNINLEWYLNPNDYSEVISGGATGVDTLAEQWAKRNGLEFCAYLPQYKVYGGKRAPIERDKDMVNAADVVVAFWDGESKGTLFTCQYANKMGVPVILNLIEER